MLRPSITHQISDTTQVTGTLFPHGRGKQHRSPGVHPRLDERLADRDERGETARVVGDAWALESGPAAGDGNIEFGTEHGIEVRGEHDGSVV